MLAGNDAEAAIRTIRCDNVRVADGRLRCVTLPKALDIVEADGMAGGRLIEVVESDRLGRVGVFDRVGGTHLGYALIDGDRRIKALAPSPGDVTGAVMLSSDRLALLSPSGIMYAEVGDSGIEWIGVEAGYPDLRFEVYDTTVAEVKVSGRRVSSVYSADSRRLNATDSAAMAKDARGAATAIINEAAGRGLYAQGVLARYRLRDREGRTLFTSVPVLLTHSLGLSFGGECQAEMADDFKSYGDWTLRAGEFRVRLVVPDNIEHDWRDMVSDAVVEMSMPVHPIGLDGGSVCEVRARAGGKMSVIYRPGGSGSKYGGSIERASGVIEAMLMAGDDAFGEVAVVRSPLDRQGAAIDIEPPVTMCGDIDDGIKKIAALCSAAMPRLTAKEAMLRQPHRLGASTVAACGDNLVWGDITVGRYEGVGCGVIAAETADEPWEGTVVTEFADRTVIVKHCGGESSAPVSLYPLIMYPSPDAMKITVKVKRASGMWKGVFPLRPSASGSCGLWMSPDSRYNRLEAAEGELGNQQSTGLTVRMPGALAVTRGSDFSRVTAVAATASAGRVTALTGMPRRGSAWEGGNLRAYMFATDGVSVVSVSDKGDRLRVQSIDRRGLSRRDGVTATTAAGAAVVAVIGGDMVRIDRSSVATLIKGVGDSRVAWDEADGELWMVNPDEGLPRVLPGCGDSHYRLTSLAAGRMWTTSRGLIVENDEAMLLDCSLGREQADADIYWEVEVESPLKTSSGRPMALTDCIVYLRSGMPVPRIDLLAGAGASPLRELPEIVKPKDEPRLRVVSLQLRGKTVVTTRLSGLMAPPRRRVWLRVSGKADAAMQLYGPRLIFGA